MSIQTVALAGASGSIGMPVLKALVEAGFTVTVLTRHGSSSATTYPANVKIAEVDYSNHDSLISALCGQDAVISTVGYTAFRTQEALFAAAIAAGVSRVIPSEFGTDPDNAAVRALLVFADKVRIEKFVKEKTAGTKTSWTLICCNHFLDWDVAHKFGVDLEKKTMEIFDGGEGVLTVTPMEFVARGVVAVLKKPEKTANRVVRLQGAAVTPNKLLEIFQKVAGRDGWHVTQASSFEREKEGYEVLQKDPANFMGWGIPLIQAAVWGKRFGGDLSANNDNSVLEMTGLTDAEIEAIVRKAAHGQIEA